MVRTCITALSLMAFNEALSTWIKLCRCWRYVNTSKTNGMSRPLSRGTVYLASLCTYVDARATRSSNVSCVSAASMPKSCMEWHNSCSENPPRIECSMRGL